MHNKKLNIIAGPCSVDENNIEEIYKLAEIKVGIKNAVYGTRVVGLKSRTVYDPTGKGMGMDYAATIKNMEILNKGGSPNEFLIPPSVRLMEQISAATNMLVATEVVLPAIQLSPLQGKLNGKLMIWNPAVNQLGWPLLQMTQYAADNQWTVGIKNGKWIGEAHEKVENAEWQGSTSIGNVWRGLTSYTASISNDIVLIQRGVDVPGKGELRNAPIHHIARQTKQATNAKLYFDPSHIHGPKMRDSIVKSTIAAMKMKSDEDEYLYDGILIEVGTSRTDTHQHITLQEFERMVGELSEFREFV